jgi:hypothetical protein
MPISAFMILPLAVLSAVCVLALIKGGASERFGAMIVLGATLVVELVHLLAPSDAKPVLLLGVDGLSAAGFLVIALRYTSFWLGGAMLFQAIQFSLHGYYLVTQQPLDHNYKTVNNIDTAGVLLCILIGTLVTWRRRVAGK